MGSPTETPVWKVGDFAINHNGIVELISEDRPGAFGVRFVQKKEAKLDAYGYQSGGCCYCKTADELQEVTAPRDVLFVLSARKARALHATQERARELAIELDQVVATMAMLGVSHGK